MSEAVKVLLGASVAAMVIVGTMIWMQKRGKAVGRTVRRREVQIRSSSAEKRFGPLLKEKEFLDLLEHKDSAAEPSTLDFLWNTARNVSFPPSVPSEQVPMVFNHLENGRIVDDKMVSTWA